MNGILIYPEKLTRAQFEPEKPYECRVRDWSQKILDLRKQERYWVTPAGLLSRRRPGSPVDEVHEGCLWLPEA